LAEAKMRGGDAPTKEEREIALKYGFSLPPLGGEPESFRLKGIDMFRKANARILQKPAPYDHKNTVNGA